MIRLVLSRPAQTDLRAIRDWIGRDNPARAVTFVEELIARFSALSAQPFLGRRRPELGRNIRVLVHGNYLIAYRVTGDVILLVRVIHGRRNLGQLLR